MKKVLVLIVCLISVVIAYANDGQYYVDGNQLIPVVETDITVQKEVLTLNRIGDKIEVTVYYEFFNPVGEKELLVGFEARGTEVDPNPTFPEHPCIRNFKVVMNGEPLKYEVAHIDYHFVEGRRVSDPYVRDGQIVGLTIEECEKRLSEMEALEAICDYVYHFKAKFRPGLNIIQHTYQFDISYSQTRAQDFWDSWFPYILTAANRWANHQIDDFKLYINMGDRMSYSINNSPYYNGFFEKASEWTINGKGRYSVGYVKDEKEYPVFHIQEGGLIFHKENFHPDGELYLSYHTGWIYKWDSEWKDGDPESAERIMDYFKKQYIPLRVARNVIKEDPYYTTFTPEQRRILKNLPFAYRGYIFNSKELQDFYESTPWYIPNPDYKADVEKLTEEEQRWVEFWSPSDLSALTKEVEKRVTDIYNHVFAEYVKLCDSHGVPSVSTFNSLYFSEEFLHLNKMIGDLEEQSGGPIVSDVDDWICAQDWGKDLKANVLSVKMVDENKAIVDVNIHNCGNDYKQTLTLIKERGNWYIDDMYNNSMRKSILEAIEDCKKEALVPRKSH